MRKALIAFLVSILMGGSIGGSASGTIPGGVSLSISPEVGRPRIPITAHGSGYLAGETVDLSFDGAVIGTAQTEPDGTFVTKVRVPSSALPGDHEVLAVGETSGLFASDTYLVQTDWARFSFDGANRWNRFENVLNPGNVGQLTELWSREIGSCYECNVVLADGVLYVAPGQEVLAVEAATGAVVWSVSITSDPVLGPVVVDGKVFAGLEDGTVLSLDALTGKTIWSVSAGRPNLYGRVLAADSERLYVPFQDGTFAAIDLHDGSPAWRVDLDSLASGAVIARGTLFIGTYDNGTYALDAATGATMWTSAASCAQCQALTYSSGLVFSGTVDGHYYSALDAATGETVWSVSLDHADGLETAAAAADGLLFIPTAEVGWFYALDASTGEVMWSRAYESDFWASAPAVANGVVYIANDNGSLVAADAGTGATLWEKELGVDHDPPIAADGRVFVEGGGTLWSLGLAGGPGP